MKYAFLILAHTDPQQLRRLVHALDDPRFDMYIHVDGKADIASFEFEKYALRYSKMTVLEQRYKVYWGDISIVNATLAMYRKAMDSDRYDRFITLSGLDYPIQSNDVIAQVLSDPAVEFIMGNIITRPEYHKVERRYFWKLKRPGILLTRLLNLCRVKKPRYITVDNSKWDIYFAPQWHALSFPCVKTLLHVLDSNPHILRYFKYAYAPDELLIPTVVFNSPEMKHRTLRCSFPEETHYNEKTAVHYLNYDPVIEVFTVSKYQQIIDSGKLFFRKARSGVSDELLDMIDETREKEVEK